MGAVTDRHYDPVLCTQRLFKIATNIRCVHVFPCINNADINITNRYSLIVETVSPANGNNSLIATTGQLLEGKLEFCGYSSQTPDERANRIESANEREGTLGDQEARCQWERECQREEELNTTQSKGRPGSSKNGSTISKRHDCFERLTQSINVHVLRL